MNRKFFKCLLKENKRPFNIDKQTIHFHNIEATNPTDMRVIEILTNMELAQ